MKVIVTGGCGLIGSHICDFYSRKGAEVISFDNLTKHELERTGYDVVAARNHVIDSLKAMNVNIVKEEDIRNKEALLEAAKNGDYIVHTAAQPAKTISIENPKLDLSTNVVGIFNVLEAARKYGISKAKEKLRWRPETSNRECVRKLADWIQRNIAIFRG